jgi:hypothetical protein
MDVLTPLVPNGEAAELVEPREGAFDHPAMATKSSAGLDALAGDAHLDATAMQELTTARDVVRLVRVHLVWTLARPTARAFDGRNRVDQFLEDDAVVAVGAGDERGERGAPSIRNNVALRARFAAIRRVRPGRRAPLFAGMLALSRQARSQSIWSASPRRSSKARWSRSQTPACCQSRRRRQQVIPDPHPISGGSISQGMPLLSTKMMPARQARSGTRGRPPFGFGGSFGSNGSTIVHNASLTNGLLMPLSLASPVPWFC